MLHITNGESVVQSFREGAIPGEFGHQLLAGNADWIHSSGSVDIWLGEYIFRVPLGAATMI